MHIYFLDAGRPAQLAKRLHKILVSKGISSRLADARGLVSRIAGYRDAYDLDRCLRVDLLDPRAYEPSNEEEIERASLQRLALARQAGLTQEEAEAFVADLTRPPERSSTRRFTGLSERDHERFCRERLPYGTWIRADGTAALFNRSYAPIFERKARGVALALSGDHVRWDHTEERFLYRDLTSPWVNVRSFRRCQEELRIWGTAVFLPKTDLPGAPYSAVAFPQQRARD